MKLTELAQFKPSLNDRAWVSIPHPTLPLLATPSSDKSVRIYSLQNFTQHSELNDGHKRSVRTVAWKPNLPPSNLSIVTGSFDATAGVWRRDEGKIREMERAAKLEIDVVGNEGDDEEEEAHDWEFSLVLEGHDSEIKSVAFSSSGQYLATCSRDKSVWIWEEIGAEGEDEWETVAVLQEHEGDVKAVSWCPNDGNGNILASASYDDTIRLWKEDSEGEWSCVSVLKGHDSTVWALDWEASPKRSDGEEEDYSKLMKPLRLISCSADATVKVWRKVVADSERPLQSNGIPSTMRPTTQEETWVVESTLPKVHDRAIYSVSWSKKTGRVVTTGSDSKVVVYEQRPSTTSDTTSDVLAGSYTTGELKTATEWHILTEVELGHGPFEINHAIWCPRFDGGRKGGEEMVVTTGDDGTVKAWILDN